MNNQKKIAICITAGEQSENHVGMNINGSGLSKKGFSLKNIRNFKKNLDDLNINYEYYRLDKMVSIDDLDKASLLIIRNVIKVKYLMFTTLMNFGAGNCLNND